MFIVSDGSDLYALVIVDAVLCEPRRQGRHLLVRSLLLWSWVLGSRVGFFLLFVLRFLPQYTFQKFKSKLNLSYFFTENQGPALARNFGVKKSEGEWVIFFDSDCTIPKNYFFVVEKFLAENNVSLYGGPDMMDESFSYLQKSINFSMTSLLTTGGIRGNKISIDKFLPRSFNMGIKREAFDEVDGFSNIRQYGEDLDLSYKLIFSGKKSSLIPKACLLYTSPSPRDKRQSRMPSSA